MQECCDTGLQDKAALQWAKLRSARATAPAHAARCAGSEFAHFADLIASHLMALGKCSFCAAAAKYRCPKCPVQYCSLACFRAPQHVHPDAAEAAEAHGPGHGPQVQDTGVQPGQAGLSAGPDKSAGPSGLPGAAGGSDRFAAIAADPVIQKLLSYKSLQVHLAVLLKILSDSLLTHEPLAENRKDIANLRLCDLRMGGTEENELVEEFVQRVLELSEAPV